MHESGCRYTSILSVFVLSLHAAITHRRSKKKSRKESVQSECLVTVPKPLIVSTIPMR